MTFTCWMYCRGSHDGHMLDIYTVEGDMLRTSTTSVCTAGPLLVCVQ